MTVKSPSAKVQLQLLQTEEPGNSGWQKNGTHVLSLKKPQKNNEIESDRSPGRQIFIILILFTLKNCEF